MNTGNNYQIRCNVCKKMKKLSEGQLKKVNLNKSGCIADCYEEEIKSSAPKPTPKPEAKEEITAIPTEKEETQKVQPLGKMR